MFVERPDGARFGIDVKAERRPLDIEAVEQLCCKLRKLELDERVIVSTSGYTGQALEEARKEGVLALRLDELEVSDIFRMEFIISRAPRDLDIEVVYADGADRAPLEQLTSAYLKFCDRVISLVELAKRSAEKHMASNSSAQERGRYTCRVELQESGTLVVGDKEWTAPIALNITWSLQVQRIPGRSFRNEKGQHVFTAVLPSDRGGEQLTLVTVPNPEGGFGVSISLADLYPPRSNV